METKGCPEAVEATTRSMLKRQLSRLRTEAAAPAGWRVSAHSHLVSKVTASAEGLLLRAFIHNLLQSSSLYELMSAPGKRSIYSDFII